jgi:hypothetical protein
MKNIGLKVCGIILILSAVLMFFGFNGIAFNREGNMQWVLTSRHALDRFFDSGFTTQVGQYGFFYFVSLIFSVIFMALGILFFTRVTKATVFKNLIVRLTVLIISGSFCLAAIIFCLTAIAHGFVGIMYIILNILNIAALIFSFILTQKHVTRQDNFDTMKSQ